MTAFSDLTVCFRCIVNCCFRQVLKIESSNVGWDVNEWGRSGAVDAPDKHAQTKVHAPQACSLSRFHHSVLDLQSPHDFPNWSLHRWIIFSSGIPDVRPCTANGHCYSRPGSLQHNSDYPNWPHCSSLPLANWVERKGINGTPHESSLLIICWSISLTCRRNLLQ